MTTQDVVFLSTEEFDEISDSGSWLTLLVAIAGPGFVSGTQDMMQDLGFSHIAISLAFSIYALGFGLGPLVLAPISEVYGRNTMYRASMVLFTRGSNRVLLAESSLTLSLQSSTSH